MAVTYKEMNVNELIECSYNPRRIEDDQKRGLKKSIKEFGLVQPIVYNERTKSVVGGNQRLSILREEGVEVTMVAVVDLPLEKEKLLNIVLNNPYIQGEFTNDVRDIIQEIENQDLSFFDDFKLNSIIKNLKVEKEIVPETYPSMELQPFEHYDYAFIVCNDVRDWNWLAEFLGLQKENVSPVGKRKIGTMRGIWFPEFKKKLEGLKNEKN